MSSCVLNAGRAAGPRIAKAVALCWKAGWDPTLLSEIDPPEFRDCVLYAPAIEETSRNYHVKNTHGLTKILTTGHCKPDSGLGLGAAPATQSSPIIHQSIVTMFFRGSKATRSRVNNTLRATVGRGDDPSTSDTLSCHPMVMVMQIMAAAASKQDRIHECMRLFLVEKIWELPV